MEPDRSEAQQSCDHDRALMGLPSPGFDECPRKQRHPGEQEHKAHHACLGERGQDQVVRVGEGKVTERTDVGRQPLHRVGSRTIAEQRTLRPLADRGRECRAPSLVGAGTSAARENE